MSDVATLTPRDVVNAGGVVTDEQLEPFVSDDLSDEEKQYATDRLREGVGGFMRYLDSVDASTRSLKLDEPIISAPVADPEAEQDADREAV